MFAGPVGMNAVTGMQLPVRHTKFFDPAPVFFFGTGNNDIADVLLVSPLHNLFAIIVETFKIKVAVGIDQW